MQAAREAEDRASEPEEGWYERIGFHGVMGSKVGMERVQAYSDAVLSIIATVLVIPLMKVNESAKREILITGGSLFDVLTTAYRMQAVFMCWMSFWVVFLVFVWHGRGFRGIATGNSALVLANWLELLATSLLPFTAATAANADSASGGELSTKNDMIRQLYGNVLLIGLAHLVFQVLANHVRSSWYSRLYLKEAFWIFLLALAAYLFSYLSIDYAALTYFGILPILGYFHLSHSKEEDTQRFAQRAERARVREQRSAEQGFLESPATSILSIDADDMEFKESFRKRIESFTDGVLAIAATLIVLDIHPIAACKDLTTIEDCVMHWTEGCRPSGWSTCVFDDNESWERRNWLVLAYVSCFVAINILWTLHHTLFDVLIPIEASGDLWTRLLNGNFCFCVSLLPFSFGLVIDYAIEPVTKHKIDPFRPSKMITPDEAAASTAIVVACCVLFFASSCLLGLLMHHKWKSGRTFSLLQYVKFSLIPLASFGIMATLSTDQNSIILFPAVAIPLVLLLIRVFLGPCA